MEKQTNKTQSCHVCTCNKQKIHTLKVTLNPSPASLPLQVNAPFYIQGVAQLAAQYHGWRNCWPFEIYGCVEKKTVYRYYRQSTTTLRSREMRFPSLLQLRECRDPAFPTSCTSPGKLADQHSALWHGTIPLKQGVFWWKPLSENLTVKGTVFGFSGLFTESQNVPIFFFSADCVIPTTLDSLTVINALQRPWNLSLIYSYFSLCFFLLHYKPDLN